MMEPRSQPWLTGFVTLICLGLLAAMSWADYWPPVPERFPEASAAFLYWDGWYEQVFAAVAIVLLVVAAMGRKARAVAAGKESVRETRIAVIFLYLGAVYGRMVSAALVLGLVFALLAVVELRRSSYTALTDTGFIAGDTGGVNAREEWSSLHHVELECLNVDPTFRMVRGYDGEYRPGVGYYPMRAKLYLHFTGGRSVNLDNLKTYKMSVEQAYMRLEAVRAKYGAPIILRDARHHKLFESGNSRVKECVDLILKRFPAERRATLASMLRQGSFLRDRTLASYR